MKKVYGAIWEALPVLWSMMLVTIITVGSLGVVIFLVKWLLTLVGVL